MTTTTIKTVIDCDYLIYLDQELNLIGYELSPDERQALSLRYHASEEATSTMPVKTIYILEVFRIHTTMVWLVENAGKKGQLLFYKPSILALSKEVAKTLDCALPIEDFMAVGNKTAEETKHLPAVVDAGTMENVLKRIPFTGWLDYYWATPTWIEIWRSRPDLQRFMTEFTSMKTKTRAQAIDAERKVTVLI